MLTTHQAAFLVATVTSRFGSIWTVKDCFDLLESALLLAKTMPQPPPDGHSSSVVELHSLMTQQDVHRELQFPLMNKFLSIAALKLTCCHLPWSIYSIVIYVGALIDCIVSSPTATCQLWKIYSILYIWFQIFKIFLFVVWYSWPVHIYLVGTYIFYSPTVQSSINMLC